MTVSFTCPWCRALHTVAAVQAPAVVGRCPTCGGWLCVFLGLAFPLDADAMESRDLETIVRHVMRTLSAYQERRVIEFVVRNAADFGLPPGPCAAPRRLIQGEQPGPANSPGQQRGPHAKDSGAPPISAAEARDIVRIELEALTRPGWGKHLGGGA